MVCIEQHFLHVYNELLDLYHVLVDSFQNRWTMKGKYLNTWFLSTMPELRDVV
jgi:hypothetical protein